jgi:hypothetical protein
VAASKKRRNGSSRFKEELHKRGPDGKFAAKPGSAIKKGKGTAGSKFLSENGADRSTTIVVKGNSKKFAGYKTVGDFMKGEPKGENYALNVLKAYHKAGLVSFGPKAQRPAPAKPTPSGGGTTAKKAGKITGDEQIEVLTKGKGGNKYKGFATVKEFAEAHPKGKAYGLKFVAADLKSGNISLKGGGSGSAAGVPKAVAAVMTKPVKQMSDAELSASAAVLQAGSTKPAVKGQHKYDDWNSVNGVKTEGTGGIFPAMQKVRDKAGVDYNYTSKAVQSYTGSGYSAINGDLRAGNPPGSRAKELDSLIKKSSFKEDTIMWRGVGGSGKVFNGAPPPSDLVDKGFTSVSFNPNVAKGFSNGSTLFRVRVPKGFPGLNIAIGSPKTSDEGLKGEAEVLLPRGTTYRVVARHKDVGPAGFSGKKFDVVDLEPVLPTGYPSY